MNLKDSACNFIFCILSCLQDKIYKSLERQDKMSQAAKHLFSQTLDSVEMLCKECNAYITKGSFMSKKGCHYTCKDPEVKQRITVVPYTKTDRYRDSETIGKMEKK